MAENENGTIPAGAPLGNRTIKLSPIKTASAQEASAPAAPSPTRTQAIPLKRPNGAIPLRPLKPQDADAQPTATVQINRPAPKPVSTHSQPISTNSGPIPAIPKKMTVKPITQTSVLKTQTVSAAPAPAHAPEAEPIPEKPFARRVATATTRIKVTGMPTKKLDLTATSAIKTGTIRPSAQTVKLNPTPAPAPAPAEDSGEQTRTVVISRKKVNPNAVSSGETVAPPPLVAKAAPAGPLGTSTVNLGAISASGKTIKLGATPAAPVAQADAMQKAADNSKTAVKLGGTPSPAEGTVKLDASSVSGTASGIKLGTVTGTGSGIKLGTVTGTASGIKLGTVTGTASGIKLGTVTGTASSLKLGTNPASKPAENTTAAQQTANFASAGLKIKKSEEPPAEEKKENAAPNENNANARKLEQAKMLANAKSGAEPNLFFSITSIAALLAVTVLTAIIVVQYLNLWEGMQIELPGLNFLTLGK